MPADGAIDKTEGLLNHCVPSADTSKFSVGVISISAVRLLPATVNVCEGDGVPNTCVKPQKLNDAGAFTVSVASLDILIVSVVCVA